VALVENEKREIGWIKTRVALVENEKREIR